MYLNPVSLLYYYYLYINPFMIIFRAEKEEQKATTFNIFASEKNIEVKKIQKQQKRKMKLSGLVKAKKVSKMLIFIIIEVH
jgi:hypothetical protein